MDKQKQIEEMAKDIVRSAGLGVYGKAEYLYDAGYRKIPENAVVLTGTETEERLVDLLVDFDEMSFFPATLTPDPDEYAREWKKKLIYAIGRLCNERVKKFAERLKEKQAPLDEYDEISIGSLFSDIDEILKEITGADQV